MFAVATPRRSLRRQPQCHRVQRSRTGAPAPTLECLTLQISPTTLLPVRPEAIYLKNCDGNRCIDAVHM